MTKITFGFHSFNSFNYSGYFIRHRNFLGFITQVSTELDKLDSTFLVVPSLADPMNPNLVSLESINYRGYYLRHQDFRIKLNQNDNSELFKNDASFFVEPGNADKDWVSFRSKNYPTRFIRHRNFELWLDENSDDGLYKKDTTFNVESPNAK